MNDVQFKMLVVEQLQTILKSIQSIKPVSLSITDYAPCPKCKEEIIKENILSNGLIGKLLPVISNGELTWQCSNKIVHYVG